MTPHRIVNALIGDRLIGLPGGFVLSGSFCLYLPRAGLVVLNFFAKRKNVYL